MSLIIHVDNTKTILCDNCSEELSILGALELGVKCLGKNHHVCSECAKELER